MALIECAERHLGIVNWCPGRPPTRIQVCKVHVVCANAGLNARTLLLSASTRCPQSSGGAARSPSTTTAAGQPLSAETNLLEADRQLPIVAVVV